MPDTGFGAAPGSPRPRISILRPYQASGGHTKASDAMVPISFPIFSDTICSAGKLMSVRRTMEHLSYSMVLLTLTRADFNVRQTL